MFDGKIIVEVWRIRPRLLFKNDEFKLFEIGSKNNKFIWKCDEPEVNQIIMIFFVFSVHFKQIL